METDKSVIYPSGSIAACVSSVAGDRITSIFSPRGIVLLLFNEKGVGTAHHASGRPWLVTSEGGFSITDDAGAVVERGTWPRSNRSPVTLDVNDHLVVTFSSKTDILATLRIQESHNTFQCGEQLRRADTRLNLDITSIRARQKASGPSGSVYVQPGPHHYKTNAPGLGAMKSTLRSLGSQSSPVSETVKGLSDLDGRISSIDMWGGGSGKTLSVSSSLTATIGSTMRRKNLPDDFGSSPMSETMTKMGRRPKPLQHKAARKRVAAMSQSDAIKGGKGIRDELLVCFYTADWNPVCGKIEAQVELANAQVTDDETLSASVKIVKVSASEGSIFSRKYAVRSVPFFFFFFEGRLVEATNNVHSSSELLQLATKALADGRKEVFLPDTFSFSGRLDNSLLDYIGQGMLA